MLEGNQVLWLAMLASGIGSFVPDWLRFSKLKKFAQESGLGTIGANPYFGPVERIAGRLPAGPMREQLKVLKAVSMLCQLVMLALVFVLIVTILLN
jgi:hypothetical protein